jgi:hypothetical protein
MNSSTKLGVTATLGSFAVNGAGAIASLDNGTLWIWDAPSGFSIYIPLEGSTFNSFDPERGLGDPKFDEPIREIGFRFVWEIRLPTGMIAVLSEFDMASLQP